MIYFLNIMSFQLKTPRVCSKYSSFWCCSNLFRRLCRWQSWVLKCEFHLLHCCTFINRLHLGKCCSLGSVCMKLVPGCLLEKCLLRSPLFFPWYPQSGNSQSVLLVFIWIVIDATFYAPPIWCILSRLPCLSCEYFCSWFQRIFFPQLGIEKEMMLSLYPLFLICS